MFPRFPAFPVRTRLALTASVVTFAALPAAPAMAACTATTPTDIECTGSNPATTVNNSGAGARTVTVAQGASVSSGVTTITAQGTPSLITNNGTIETDSSGGSTDYAAAIATSNTGTARIVNNSTGVITGIGTNVMGARFIASNGVAELVNAGTISAGGSSTSGSFGPRAVAMFASSSDARVINSGTITSTSVGVAIDHGGTGETYVSNAAGAEISGAATGIYVRNARGPVQIDNAGDILRTSTGSGGFLPGAIAIFDQNPAATGTQVIINNSGTIANAGGSNTYAIYAAQAANGVLEVVNTGTITGNISQFGGLSALIDNAGAINGNVQGGAGDDTVILRGPNVVLNGNIIGGGGSANVLRFIDADNLVMGPSQVVGDIEIFDLASGTLTLDGANWQLFGDTGAFNIGSGTTLRVQGATSSILFNDGGVTTSNGTLVAAPNSRLQLATGTGFAHDFVAASGSITRFVLDTVSGTTTFHGQIRATNITFASGSQIDLDVRDLGLLVNGRTFDVAVATNSLTDASGAITDNSLLFDFSKMVVGGTTLRITMQQLLSIADTIDPADPNSAALAGALQSFIDSGSPSGSTVSTLLGGFSTVDDLSAAVADFAPDSSNMVALAALDMIDPVFVSVRDRAASHDFNHGDIQFWLAGGLFGSSLDAQGMHQGFEADGSHFAVGAEGRFGGRDSLAVGLAFDHASSDGEAGLSRADLSSDRLYAYAFLPTGPLRFDAVVGLGWGKAKTERLIPVLGDTAMGRADLDTSFGRIGLGYDLGKGPFKITPLAVLQFANVTVGAYEEAGSVGALRYAERKVKSARADIGVGLAWSAEKEGKPAWSLTSSLRYASQLNDLDGPLRAQFTGGGSGFGWSVNDLPGDSWELEAGARTYIGRFGTLSLTYRGSFADGADAQAGLVTLSMGF